MHAINLHLIVRAAIDQAGHALTGGMIFLLTLVGILILTQLLSLWARRRDRARRIRDWDNKPPMLGGTVAARRAMFQRLAGHDDWRHRAKCEAFKRQRAERQTPNAKRQTER